VRILAFAIVLAGVALASPAGAFAQSCARMAFADHTYVNLETLTDRAEQFNGQCLRTKGRLVLRGRSRPRDEEALRGSWQVELKDPETGQTVFLVPGPLIAERFNRYAFSMVSRMVEVAGVFSFDPQFPSPTLQFMGYELMAGTTARPASELLTACDVAGSPEAYRGQKVVVWAPFRGRNAFGDLPDETRPDAGAWVIGDEDCAVWITGRSPSGEGFSLDTPSSAAPWLKVEGKLQQRADAVVLKASRVLLAKPRD
jgi:hypothetical protein